MPKSAYKVADVFTETPLKGNPVAVFLDAGEFSSELMQDIAREMQLSETVFTLPPKANGTVRVRIFTPVNELPFAGHPTLGAAIVLGETLSDDCIYMETGMGTVPFYLERTPEGRARSARMVQPIPTWRTYDRIDELLKGLKLSKSTMPIEVYCNGPQHVFIGLDNVTALSALQPDHHTLSFLPDVAVNCFAPDNRFWQMRMFSPAYGVIEDAATGSAAGPLAIHLARHGHAAFGDKITIVQGVDMGRKSTMYARIMAMDSKIKSVEVTGSAIVVLRGEIDI